MDQLASAAGEEGRALLIDCHTLEVELIPVPEDAEFVVRHSGQSRELAGSAYATRKAECERAEILIGPLRTARPDDVPRIKDPVVRARARHVISENERVRRFAAALRNGQLDVCGRLMKESHASLAADFAVSTPTLDGLVAELNQTDGVYGARLTGAGLGGCVVALCRPGTDIGGWPVRPSPGAHLVAD
jgi:galactokinase